jgi:DNA-binding NtrC family response regulator
MIRPRLLCVDDDADFRGFCKTALGTFGFEVTVAGDGAQALSLFHPRKVDAVLLDYQMPGMNGGELAAEIKRRSPGMPVIMISGSGPVLEDARNFVDAAIDKGTPLHNLVERIERLLAERQKKAGRLGHSGPAANLGQALAH